MSTTFTIGRVTFTANRALTAGPKAPLERAAEIVKVAAQLYYVPARDFFIADHTHEELPRGSASIAWEGSQIDMGWAPDFVERPEAREIERKLGVFLEPINNCILGVYLNRD